MSIVGTGRTIAVTGADGFVGTHLCAALEGRGHRVIRIVRREGTGGNRRLVSELTNEGAVAGALQGADAVVHLAARAHVLRDDSPDAGAAFRRVNVDGTRALCLAARSSGVPRIVFVSSIGVNGSRTDGRPFVETDAPAPVELYARSKWEAEEMLRGQTAETGVETVVLRPALVYGPGVKGNFLRLLRLASSGLPLPLGSIRNRRNLVGVQNLCDLLILCTDNPRAAGQMYLAADPDVHSTADLIRALCRGLNRPCRLLPVPEAVVRGIARVTGFEDQFNKLCGSLEVCSDKARNELGWTPRARFDEEIARTTAWFLEHEQVREH